MILKLLALWLVFIVLSALSWYVFYVKNLWKGLPQRTRFWEVSMDVTQWARDLDTKLDLHPWLWVAIHIVVLPIYLPKFVREIFKNGE